MKTNKKFPLDSHVLIVSESNYIFMKVMICLANSARSKYDKLHLFANCVMIGLNLFLAFQEVFLLLYNKFEYMRVDLYLNVHCFVNKFILLMQILIIWEKYFDLYYFIYSLIQSILIALGITYYFIKVSALKLVNNDNYLGMVLYLLKERDNSHINKIMTELINKHKSLCCQTNCKLCKRIYKKQMLTPEKLAAFLYKTYIKDRNILFNETFEFKAIYYLVDLYISFISEKKTLIKIILKYDHIKACIRNTTTKINDNLHLKTNNKFSNNFYLNLELLYHEIIEQLLKNNDNQKLSYLIITDKISIEIKSFIKMLRNFLFLHLRSPQEIMKLSKNFSKLNKTIDFEYLISKENKLNYPCLIYSYIMEEIFNDHLNPVVCIGDLIHSLDELLDYKYKEDSLLLAMYDFNYNKIIIKSIGKDLIHLKNESFDKIFPVFLRKEGYLRLLKSLKQNTENYFEFYYLNKNKGTVDRFKMKFMGIPSLDFDCQSVYIACNYILEKDNFFIFEIMDYIIKDNKVLVAVSESVANYLKLTHEHIMNTHTNKTYLTFDQIFFSQSDTLNYDSIEYYLRKKFGIKNIKLIKKKNLVYFLKERIGQFEVYVLREKDLKSKTNKIVQLKEHTLIIQQTEEEIDYNIALSQNEAINFFEATHTGMSSSQLTNSVFGSFNKGMNSVKNEQSEKYKKFFMFTYILIAFNIVILIVMSLFLVIQLKNNVELEQTFIIIKNFNDFQSNFYHAALSVFSLTCNSDYLTQMVCCNQFTEFCVNFSLENGLTMNELMNDYLARELTYKSDLVIASLKTWERDRYYINSKELDDILAEDFVFCIIEEVDLKLSVVSIKLNFEDAIKRFINLVNLIPTFDNYLTSVIWTITSDGYENVDLTNIWLEKYPYYGVWLTEVQKHYYACLLNFQKYLLRMFSMADLLYEYYEHKIQNNGYQILIFILLFILLHLVMLGMSLMFILQYKVLHMGFFVMIFMKTSDVEFKKYYDDKLTTLLLLLDLYKQNPNELINHLYKIKTNEKQRLQIEGKNYKNKNPESQSSIQDGLFFNTSSSSKSVLNDFIKTNFNEKELNSIYNKTIIIIFILKLIVLFTGYILIIVILYVISFTSILNLSLMNKYIKYNYDSSNNIYLNLALLQIMSLTNQTDVQMDLYFGINDSIHNQGNDGYVRRNLQRTSDLLNEVDLMERENSFFKPLSEVINLNCETLYKEIQDPIITAMINGYPSANYEGLLAKYCAVYSNLKTYPDDKMTLNIITYKTSKVLDLFLDTTYRTYEIITNCLLIYQIYTEILMIVRPIRRYLYEYLIDDVIKKILNNHNLLMIMFLLINFIYEIMILIIIKFGIINKIIKSSKEIIVVAKAFECI